MSELLTDPQAILAPSATVRRVARAPKPVPVPTADQAVERWDAINQAKIDLDLEEHEYWLWIGDLHEAGIGSHASWSDALGVKRQWVQWKIKEARDRRDAEKPKRRR